MAGPPVDDRLSAAVRRVQRPPRGRRVLSWLLLLATLGGFLVLPVLGSAQAERVRDWLSSVPALGALLTPALEHHTADMIARRPSRVREATALPAPPPPPTLLGLDRSWDPGPVASAHGAWAYDCKICHATPFARVADVACLSCHAGIGDHVEDAALTVHGLSGVRCATCHRDHKGVFGLANQNRHFLGAACADCHADIARHAPETALAEVADFADEHPGFRIQVRSGAEPDAPLQRVALDAGVVLKEPIHLKFPHDVHLDEKGIDSPRGNVRMECKDCHEADDRGVGFRPVAMRMHCQSCHTLKLEPALAAREVPHGSEKEVLSTIREFYAYAHLTGSAVQRAPQARPALGVQRPGEKAIRGASVGASANVSGDPLVRARQVATELFEKTSCAVCHTVVRLAESGPADSPGRDLPQWRVEPIARAPVRMPGSIFDHRTHAMQECTECHAATRSKHAEEVLMPAIDTCRECHAGSRPTPHRVTSDCGLCHGFHTPGRLILQHEAVIARDTVPRVEAGS